MLVLEIAAGIVLGVIALFLLYLIIVVIAKIFDMM